MKNHRIRISNNVYKHAKPYIYIYNLVSDWRIRNAIFLVISVLAILPTILVQRFQMDWDAWFHISRIYELVQGMKFGRFIPDVSYFSFNNRKRPITRYLSNLSLLQYTVIKNKLEDFLCHSPSSH